MLPPTDTADELPAFRQLGLEASEIVTDIEGPDARWANIREDPKPLPGAAKTKRRPTGLLCRLEHFHN